MRLSIFFKKRHKKKYRTTRLALWLEKLLDSVWNKKLWILTYSVLIAAVYYGSNLGKGLSEDPQETEENYQLLVQQYQADYKRILAVHEKVQTSMATIVAVNMYYPEVLNSLAYIPLGEQTGVLSVDKQKVNTGLQKVHQAREDLISLIALIKGSRFQSEMFAGFFDGYAEDLREMDNGLLAFEDFYNTLLNKRADEWVEASHRLNLASFKFLEASETLKYRSESSIETAQSIGKKLDIEQNKKERDDLVLAIRGLIFLVMIALAVFLGVLAFKSIRAQKRYTAMQGGNPASAKSQREKYHAMRNNKTR